MPSLPPPRRRLGDEGPAHHPSPVALLLIDVVNPMDFPGAERLLPAAVPAASRIARLRSRAADHDVPAIYVNDNFDCWHLGFRELVERFRAAQVPGIPIIDQLEPQPSADYYILKPLHSGFFRTGLEVLLRRLQATTLILCGFATDICVLFTANDAYMRGFNVIVPSDCVAAESMEDHTHALRQMERLLKADVCPSERLNLEALLRNREVSRARVPA